MALNGEWKGPTLDFSWRLDFMTVVIVITTNSILGSIGRQYLI